jgi:hypothetical protein
MQINDAYARLQSGDLSLIEDALNNNTKRRIKQNGGQPLTPDQIEEQRRAMVRAQGIVARNAFTSCLSQHGVHGKGFAECSNETYKPIIGGTAKAFKAAMGLPATANIRDELPMKYLGALMFSEILATENIEKDDLRGNHRCKTACREASEKVAGIM